MPCYCLACYEAIATDITTQKTGRAISVHLKVFYPAIALLLLLLKELGDGCCLGLLASAKMGVAADAGIPWGRRGSQ